MQHLQDFMLKFQFLAELRQTGCTYPTPALTWEERSQDIALRAIPHGRRVYELEDSSTEQSASAIPHGRRVYELEDCSTEQSAGAIPHGRRVYELEDCSTEQSASI